MSKAVNEIGNRYGRWVVVKKEGQNKRKAALWTCVCECGNIKIVAGTYLRNGSSKSCGCLRKEKAAENGRIACTVHGLSHHPLYSTWAALMGRCYNKNIKHFQDYGGRGIRVYKSWHDIENFINWVEKNLGPRPENYTLDRINNNGSYEPGNLRWADAKTQSRNQRLLPELEDFLDCVRKENKYFTFPRIDSFLKIMENS